MRVMASLALYTGGIMLAGAPFVGGAFMAGAAQVRIGFQGHRFSWMVWLEGTMAGFARDALFAIGTVLSIETGGMALQAAGLFAQFTPIALEDRRGESHSMASRTPLRVDVLMAVATGR